MRCRRAVHKGAVRLRIGKEKFLPDIAEKEVKMIKLGIIFGGRSEEHEVSRLSATSVIGAVDTSKYEIVPIGITRDGRWYLYDGPVEKIATGEWEEYAVKALEAYEVSEPVQSDYGYHIILRLPDDPDSVIDYTSQNTPMTARKYWANADYAERMEAVLGETKLEYVPGFVQVELADFIK